MKQSNETQQKSGKNLFVRIAAIAALIIIVGMYILSFVASVSDWEYSFEIFLVALACTVFLPIIIYIAKIFANMKIEHDSKKS